MGSISMLTVVALVVTIYYSKAMHERVPTSTPRRNPIRELRHRSRGADPLNDVEGNRNAVLARIEKGEFSTQQETSDDPCRRYQIAKSKAGLRLNEPFPRPRSSRDEQTPSPANTAAIQECATGFNAFNALPPEYRITCPEASSPTCKLLDGWYTCVVAVPKKIKCCTYNSVYVSLKRCANEIIEEKKQDEENQRIEVRKNRDMAYLSRAASLAKGASPSTPAPPPPNFQGRAPGGSGAQGSGGRGSGGRGGGGRGSGGRGGGTQGSGGRGGGAQGSFGQRGSGHGSFVQRGSGQGGGGQQIGGQQSVTHPPSQHRRTNSW